MSDGGEFVFIGSNAWPLLGLAVIMVGIGWWLSTSGKPPRQGVPLSEAVRWSFLKHFFPGVHAWLLSNDSDAGSDDDTPDERDEQTDETGRRADRALSGDLQEPRRFAVDRTRQAVLEELLTHGWTVTDLRREGIFRGDNTVISQEVAEARKQLGMAPPEEYRTPIAGRPTNAALYQDDPELSYQPPPR